MGIAVHQHRALSVSAASGLVIEGDALYVIADDGLHLHAYSLHDAAYEKRLRLCEGELPANQKARKKLKPDFEALVRVPAQPDLPHGGLLALGSGSKANRRQGVLVPFHADGTLNEHTRKLDLTALYAPLPFCDTNIEGAFILDDQLVLMQRGNNTYPQSALVYFPLRAALQGHAAATVVAYTLHSISGIPLGFSDGTVLANGQILFSAVAENTDNSVDDGVCAGAALGIINTQGELAQWALLAQPHKIEGIAFTTGDAPKLYAVTDADDPQVPAGLFEVHLPAGWLA